MGRIFGIFAIVAIMALAGIFIAGRFFKLTIFQSVPVLKSINCAYPIAIAGDSMDPALKSGSRAVFNQCVEKREDLPAKTVILYKESGIARIFRIKERIQKDGKVFYLIDRDNRKGETLEVAADKIIAIWNK